MRLRVKLAETEEEKLRAYHLRHQCFVLEKALGYGGTISSDKIESSVDKDQFDEHCDHLIVIDELSEEVLGTYRILAGNTAKRNGFYSEQFFQLRPFQPWMEEAYELGRSCVRADHRSGRIIAMLWQGLGAYIRERGVRFLIGLPSIHPANEEELSRTYAYLVKHYRSPLAWIEPKPGYSVNLEHSIALTAEEEQDVFRQLPPLFKGYLRSGARIAGPPAYDPELASTLIMTVMECSQINERYRRSFVDIQ